MRVALLMPRVTGVNLHQPTVTVSARQAKSTQIKNFGLLRRISEPHLGQIYKAADWYEKTQKFQRAVAKGDVCPDSAEIGCCLPRACASDWDHPRYGGRPGRLAGCA
jgi:hypothetical protein